MIDGCAKMFFEKDWLSLGVGARFYHTPECHELAWPPGFRHEARLVLCVVYVKEYENMQYRYFTVLSHLELSHHFRQHHAAKRVRLRSAALSAFSPLHLATTSLNS